MLFCLIQLECYATQQLFVKTFHIDLRYTTSLVCQVSLPNQTDVVKDMVEKSLRWLQILLKIVMLISLSLILRRRDSMKNLDMNAFRLQKCSKVIRPTLKYIRKTFLLYFSLKKQ